MNTAVLVGKLLGPRIETLSLLRTSELSFQQLANNNVLSIGAPVFFQGELQGLPVQLDLVNLRLAFITPNKSASRHVQDGRKSRAASAQFDQFRERALSFRQRRFQVNDGGQILVTFRKVFAQI